MIEIHYYILTFFIYSFLGYIAEVTYCSVGERRFVNRGFLYGPWLPIYGFGGVFVVLFLSRFKGDGVLGFIAIFFLTGIIASIIEYIGSYLLERLFSIKLWDYSAHKYNIHGRVCLKNSTLFAIMGTLIVYLLETPISNLIEAIPILYLRIASITLLSLFSIDFILSTMKMASFKKALHEISDRIEEDYEELIEHIRMSYRRIILSFPGATSIRDEFRAPIELIRAKELELKERIKKLKG